MPALCAEDNITEHGNVVVESDAPAAGRAAGVGEDNRLFERNSMNYNVEKTADDCTKNSGENVTNCWGNNVQIDHLNPFLSVLSAACFSHSIKCFKNA